MFEYLLSKFFDGFSFKVKTVISITIILFFLEILFVYNFFYNTIIPISKQNQEYIILIIIFFIGIWSVILGKIIMIVNDWYLSRGIFWNTENLLFSFIGIILLIPFIFGIYQDMNGKNKNINNISAEQELKNLFNNAIKENSFNKLIIDKFNVNTLPDIFNEKVTISLYKYVKNSLISKNEINDDLIKLYVKDVNFHKRSYSSYISIELTEEGMKYFSTLEENYRIKINSGDEVILSCVSQMCPGYNLLVVDDNGESIPHLGMELYDGTSLERTLIFNEIAKDLGYSNRIVDFSKISEKINKNIDYFNNESGIYEGELGIFQKNNDYIIDLAYSLEEKEFIETIKKLKNIIITIQEDSTYISDKELIKIFKLVKEKSKKLGVNRDDSTYLFQILYHIKQSYYFGKVYFVLDGYIKGHEDLERQYLEKVGYFKDKGIGNFSNNKIENIELSIDEVESVSMMESSNIRDAIAEGAGSSIRMKH